MERHETLADLFAAYRRRHMPFAAASTIKQYEITLRHLVRFLGRTPRLSDLTDDTLLDAMIWFRGRGRSERAVNKLRSNVSTLWRFANAKGWIRTLPDVPKLHEPERLPVAWLDDELRRLFAQFRTLCNSICGVPEWLFWTTLHLVLFDTAERIGAVLQLPWSSVSLDAGTVTFAAETRKRKTRDRLHRLHPQTVELLRQMELPRKLVWEWPYSPSYLWIRLRKIVKDAGLPDDRAHRFHAMRKTTASQYERAGHNATQLLDHSSRAITLKAYLDPRIVGTRAVAPADVLDRPGETG